MSKPEELRLAIGGRELAALHWPCPGGPRLICLHGWLDNADSFAPLAPFLKGLDIIALDFAGHGHSDHRPQGSNYYFTEYLWDLEYVLEALNWERCHLLGHSLGGVVASAFAAAAPERTETLSMLDGIGAPVSPPEKTTERLARSLNYIRNRTGRLREFETPEQATAARLKVSDMSQTAAGILCARNLERHGDHFRWRTDPRLNWVSPFLMTEEQVMDILSHIACPTLSVYGSAVDDWLGADVARRRHGAISDCETGMVEGHHHFHLDWPQSVAPFILDFLGRRGGPI